MSLRTVLVTGATGFIAAHIIDILLEKGYGVIGIARSEAKYRPFLDAFQKKYPSANLKYEIVEDMAKDRAFNSVLKKHKEVTAVIHTASTVVFGLKNISMEDAYLKPIVTGTLNLLNGIKEYAPQITNLVVTGSFLSITDFSGTFTGVYTSKTWNSLKWEDCIESEVKAYAYAKKVEEQEAFEFVKAGKANFKVATVVPPYVFGPQLFEFSVNPVLNNSNSHMQSVLSLDKNLTEPLTGHSSMYVNVRDVATFHILPLENEKLAEARQVVVGGAFCDQTIANVLNKQFPGLEGHIVKGDPESEAGIIEVCKNYDISQLVKDAGDYKFISVEKTITDTFAQYFKVHPFKE